MSTTEKATGHRLQATGTDEEPTIMGSLERRPHSRAVASEVREIVRDLRRRRHDAAGYRGGLAAEQQSAVALRARRKADRRLLRASAMRRVGRRIDLIAMLNCRDAQGRPAWAIVDPRHSISSSNGRYDADGWRSVGGNYYAVGGLKARKEAAIPSGVPALPAQARELFTAPKFRRLRKRAKWIGVLYQPAEWTAVNPDPAVVVEWIDRPGEYYALMVWGVDGPAIQEFIS
jgi:hypothetical protein